jgi:hypothetical protein
MFHITKANMNLCSKLPCDYVEFNFIVKEVTYKVKVMLNVISI